MVNVSPALSLFDFSDLLNSPWNWCLGCSGLGDSAASIGYGMLSVIVCGSRIGIGAHVTKRQVRLGLFQVPEAPDHGTVVGV